MKREILKHRPHAEVVMEAKHHIANRSTMSKNTRKELVDKSTFSQRWADWLTAFMGSWPFVIGVNVFSAAWMAVNSFQLLASIDQSFTHTLGLKPFDPFPYILLNLVFSWAGMSQPSIIMMSQARTEARNAAQSEHHYEVSLKTELQMNAIHDHVEKIEKMMHSMAGTKKPEVP